MFRQLTYTERVANNATIIDNFPERMERFLNCISQVYFEQESFDAIVTGNDKAAGKKLMQRVECGSQQQQQSAGLQVKNMPGVDNWDYYQHMWCYTE